MIMKIICWCWLTVVPWIMLIVFFNKTSRWFKYVCIKLWTCKISARFHSLTERSPDRNGPNRKVVYPIRLRQLLPMFDSPKDWLTLKKINSPGWKSSDECWQRKFLSLLGWNETRKAKVKQLPEHFYERVASHRRYAWKMFGSHTESKLSDFQGKVLRTTLHTEITRRNSRRRRGIARLASKATEPRDTILSHVLLWRKTERHVLLWVRTTVARSRQLVFGECVFKIYPI